jgi:hypothetical protein
MHLEGHEVVQGTVNVHYDPHVAHLQGYADRKVQADHEAH